MKVHILEGSQSNGTLIYACGRRGKRGDAPYVGRALIMTNQGTAEVSCESCRKKYRHYCCAAQHKSVANPRNDSERNEG